MKIICKMIVYIFLLSTIYGCIRSSSQNTRWSKQYQIANDAVRQIDKTAIFLDASAIIELNKFSSTVIINYINKNNEKIIVDLDENDQIKGGVATLLTETSPFIESAKNLFPVSSRTYTDVVNNPIEPAIIAVDPQTALDTALRQSKIDMTKCTKPAILTLSRTTSAVNKQVTWNIFIQCPHPIFIYIDAKTGEQQQIIELK